VALPAGVFCRAVPDFLDMDRTMQPDRTDEILSLIRTACSGRTAFKNERDFQLSIAAGRPDIATELRISFTAPSLPLPLPTAEDIQACALAEKRRDLPTTGKDPCVKRPKLDILWKQNGSTPVELKYVRTRKSDVYGYDLLKDIHRLERLHRILTPQGEITPTIDRYAVFLTPVPDYWSEPSKEPEEFRLTHGCSTPARYKVQYAEQSLKHKNGRRSPIVRWFDYPPFFLSSTYKFCWNDLGAVGRCLVVRVLSQSVMIQ
jgi:hypothetical protein